MVSRVNDSMVLGVISFLFAYIGHGGSATAQYISEELPRKITELLNLNSSEQTLETIPSILREAFVSVDQQMIQDFETTFRGSLILPISRWRSSHIESKLNDPAVYEIASRTMSGSTALVAYIDGEGLQIANTGDCRAGELILNVPVASSD